MKSKKRVRHTEEFYVQIEVGIVELCHRDGEPMLWGGKRKVSKRYTWERQDALCFSASASYFSGREGVDMAGRQSLDEQWPHMIAGGQVYMLACGLPKQCAVCTCMWTLEGQGAVIYDPPLCDERHAEEKTSPVLIVG